MAFPTSLNIIPTTPAATHRTVTGLDGAYPPPASHADWLEQPAILFETIEEDQITRFYVNLVIRGTTGLADDPVITFRPYVRNGGASGTVAACQSISFTRPRLKDLPSIKYQKTVDNGASYTDYSANIIDNNAATEAVLDALDTIANGDWIVVGGPAPFCGIAVDMDAVNVNANTSALSAHYWNGSAWVALTNLTDGTTAVAGRTHSGDGQITWTMPSAGAWAASTINSITAYWVRLSVSAALSANVKVEEVDLLMPVQCGIDVAADQDAVLLFLESQDAVVSGTLAYEGSIKVSWR